LFISFYFVEQLHIDINYVPQSVEHETLYVRVVDYWRLYGITLGGGECRELPYLPFPVLQI